MASFTLVLIGIWGFLNSGGFFSLGVLDDSGFGFFRRGMGFSGGGDDGGVVFIGFWGVFGGVGFLNTITPFFPQFFV